MCPLPCGYEVFSPEARTMLLPAGTLPAMYKRSVELGFAISLESLDAGPKVIQADSMCAGQTPKYPPELARPCYVSSGLRSNFHRGLRRQQFHARLYAIRGGRPGKFLNNRQPER